MNNEQNWKICRARRQKFYNAVMLILLRFSWPNDIQTTDNYFIWIHHDTSMKCKTAEQTVFKHASELAKFEQKGSGDGQLKWSSKS